MYILYLFMISQTLKIMYSRQVKLILFSLLYTVLIHCLFLVADNYGVTAYAVCLFLLTIWFSEHWGEATACPYNHFEGPTYLF
jgi:hypothetical protein